MIADCWLMLQLENFLLADPSPDAMLKLADFGLSKFTKPTDVLRGCCGTPQYMAPEVLAEHYNIQADMWSCGVVLYIILSGTYPFPGSSQEHIRARIQAGPPDMTSRAWEKISSAAKDCIQKLLTADPSARPLAEEILKHPFLSGEHTLDESPLDADVILQLRRFVGVLRFKQVRCSRHRCCSRRSSSGSRRRSSSTSAASGAAAGAAADVEQQA